MRLNSGSGSGGPFLRGVGWWGAELDGPDRPGQDKGGPAPWGAGEGWGGAGGALSSLSL